MNNRYIAGHKKTQLILCGLIAAALTVFLNCSSGWRLHSKDMRSNETFPPLETLPIIFQEMDYPVLHFNRRPVGWKIIGRIEVIGSQKDALKQAAKLGAEGVVLYRDDFEFKGRAARITAADEITHYETEGFANGYGVILYRKLFKSAKKPDITEIW